MTPRGLFIGTLGVSLFNGLASPALPLLFFLAPIWMPEFVPATNEARFYAASLVVSFGTLLVAGIPAAVFERVTGRRSSDTTSMLVWLACAVVLSLPALQQIMGASAG
ncbi:MAG: hypothetical protein AB7S71_23665 [Dongiaceae bacterium]